MQLNDRSEFRSDTTEPVAHGLKKRRDDAERLAASERQYRALIDASSDGIFLFDADRTIRLMSRSGERLFGRTAEEMEKISPEDLLHPDDAVPGHRGA